MFKISCAKLIYLDVFLFQMTRAEFFVLLFHFGFQQAFDVFFDVTGPPQFVGGLFSHFTSPQFVAFAFHFTSPLVDTVGAETVHQRTDGQPDGLFQSVVTFNYFTFGQFLKW